MQIQKIKQNHWFTLVELIVVITILAILGTIAFISLQWYSTNARDSTRISDVWSMKTSLELFQLEAGKYPIPTDGVDITYSWATVWTQWSFWETVYANVTKLDKIPTDPLTDKEYTYSVISTRNEYEISWIIEWEALWMNNNLISQSLAWTVEATAYVSWNYNWLMTKTLNGNACKILSLPTILTNDTTVTDLQDIITQKRFVYNWFKNLASSFKWSKFKEDGWFDFQPAQLIAYSDTGSCADLTANTWSWTSARVTLLQWLQNSYSWTVIENEWEIKNVVNVVIDENNPSTEVVNLVWNLVNNNFWGKVVLGWNTSNTTSTVTCENIVTQSQVDDLNAIWQTDDLIMYWDLIWDIYFDYAVDWPFTISQYCNDVYTMTFYVTDWINSDLSLVYNAMNNLWQFTYWWSDYLTKKTVLDSIPHLNLWITWWYDTSVFTWTNLEWLYLDSLWLTSIPSSIWNLVNLKWFSLYDNPITSLPAELWTLSNLEYLDLSYNSLSSISASIWNLTNLQQLYIEWDWVSTIWTLPSSVWNLVNLTDLIVVNEWLTSIPSTIWNLTNLKLLWLFWNNNTYSSLPNEIWSLTGLNNLSLSSNINLNSLPTTFSNLTNLNFLSMQWTNLWNLSVDFDENSPNATQWWMTIWWNGTNIVITWIY